MYPGNISNGLRLGRRKKTEALTVANGMTPLPLIFHLIIWKQAPNLAPKQANHLSLTLTSSSLSACICIVLPLNKFFSNFSFPLLETWEATVIFQMVKKWPCPEYLTAGLDLGALWGARKPVTHVVKPRADDAPCMTPGSEHPQELGCAGNSVTSLVYRRGNHQLYQSLVLTLAFSINFD